MRPASISYRSAPVTVTDTAKVATKDLTFMT